MTSVQKIDKFRKKLQKEGDDPIIIGILTALNYAIESNKLHNFGEYIYLYLMLEQETELNRLAKMN